LLYIQTCERRKHTILARRKTTPMSARFRFIYYLLQVMLSIALATGCTPSAKVSNYNRYRFNQPTTDSIPEGKVSVTFLGVASLLIDDGETQLLTDGFVTRPALLKTAFGKIGSDTAIVKQVINKVHIRRLKAVFCAHSHYDHAMDAPYFARFTGARLFGSSSTLNIARGCGLPESAMEQYIPEKPLHFGRFTVTILKSKHTPALKILGAKDDVGQDITAPLHQPAKLKAYTEGGAYDVLIQHGKHSILIKASTNFIPGALDSVHADVLFLGVATLSKQDTVFQNNYYAQTVSKVHPQILVPIHWDNFFTPLSNNLKPYPKLADNVRKDFGFLISKTRADNIQFRIMQGFERVLLF